MSDLKFSYDKERDVFEVEGMRQKKVELKETGLETEYELPGLKIIHFEKLTKPPRIYWSRISDPDKWVDEEPKP